MGKIIDMRFVHEVIPWAGHANYATSKGGLVMLMQAICQEYGPDKYVVLNITECYKNRYYKDVWSTKEDRESMLKLIPYKQIGISDDIGSVASWLASDEYINRTTIFVDGGMTCYPGFTKNG